MNEETLQRPIITIVACIACDNVIGYDGAMPWSLPEDMRRFKEITMNKPVIMGGRTAASLGWGLPNRYNIVVSSDWMRVFHCCNTTVFVAQSFEDALKHASKNKFPEVFVIGGQSIYEQAMPLADRLLLTELHEQCEGDRFFPEFDATEFELKRDDLYFASTERAYSFVEYERKRW